jgi:hypothetical protein
MSASDCKSGSQTGLSDVYRNAIKVLGRGGHLDGNGRSELLFFNRWARRGFSMADQKDDTIVGRYGFAGNGRTGSRTGASAGARA